MFHLDASPLFTNKCKAFSPSLYIGMTQEPVSVFCLDSEVAASDPQLWGGARGKESSGPEPRAPLQPEQERPPVMRGHGEARSARGKARLIWLSFGLALMLLHPYFWISEKPDENQDLALLIKWGFGFWWALGWKDGYSVSRRFCQLPCSLLI